MTPKQIGVLFVLVEGLLYAFEPIFAKLSYANANYFQSVGMRVLIMAMVGYGYHLIVHRKKQEVSPKQFTTITAIALFGTVFADLLYFYALTQVPVLNAVFLGHLQPIFIVLVGSTLLREEKLNKNDFVGIVVMMVAGLLITTRTLPNLLNLQFGTWGDLLVLLVTFAWAMAAIVAKKYLKDINPGTLVFYRYSIASIVLVPVLILHSQFAFVNVYQIGLGLVAGLGIVFYYESLRRIKAAQTAALELSTPLFAAIFGFIILGENVTWIQMVAMLLVGIGVHYLSKREE